MPINWAAIGHLVSFIPKAKVASTHVIKHVPSTLHSTSSKGKTALDVASTALTSPDKLFDQTPGSQKTLTSFPFIGSSEINFSSMSGVNPPTILTSENGLSSNISAEKLPIGPDTRVLIIGDSHTAGTYGKHLDDIVRETGATVETHGSCGSSPGSWFNGWKTTCGYYGENEQGKITSNKWKKVSVVDPKTGQTKTKLRALPFATPKINSLTQRFKPDIVIVSLGANMINASEDSIKDATNRMAEAIGNSGAKIYWVGSPSGDPSKKPLDKVDKLNQAVQNAVVDDGTYIEARDYMRYYGSDGRHLGGSKGSAMARLWAQGVLDQIQYGKTVAHQKLKTHFQEEQSKLAQKYHNSNQSKYRFDESFEEVFSRNY